MKGFHNDTKFSMKVLLESIDEYDYITFMILSNKDSI